MLLAKLPTTTDAKPDPSSEKSLSRNLSEKLELVCDSVTFESESERSPRMIPTARASESLQIEVENSSDRAILASCLRLGGISSESDRRKRLRSEDRRLTASAEDEIASATEKRAVKSLTSFRRLTETEGR